MSQCALRSNGQLPKAFLHSVIGYIDASVMYREF